MTIIARHEHAMPFGAQALRACAQLAAGYGGGRSGSRVAVLRIADIYDIQDPPPQR
ncbi:MAG TPA: hypothetical protein VFF69_09450 [Phycisphaerales bacterium]|nr:hypothetical protein [Phycisphaerales bacterium]